MYNAENGLFSFASYRDPHIVSTLNVYDEAKAFICSGDYSNEDVKEAILQVCSEVDKPDAPGAAARKAFYRKIISLSDEMRNDYKLQLLKLDRDRVTEVAQKYFNASHEDTAVAVISSEQKLNEANAKLEKGLKLFSI